MQYQFSVVFRKKGLVNNYITTLKAYYRTKSRVKLTAFALKTTWKNLFILYLFDKIWLFYPLLVYFVVQYYTHTFLVYNLLLHFKRGLENNPPPFPFLRLGVGRANMFKTISPRGKPFPLGKSQRVQTISHVRILLFSCSYITSWKNQYEMAKAHWIVG